MPQTIQCEDIYLQQYIYIIHERSLTQTQQIYWNRILPAEALDPANTRTPNERGECVKNL